MHSNVFIIYELSSARQQRDVWNQVELPPCSTASYAELHGSCRAKVESNSINLVQHSSSTTFETGLEFNELKLSSEAIKNE